MTQNQQFYSALVFAVVFFAFLAYAFFKTEKLNPARHLILRIMTALFGGIAAGLITGSAMIKWTEKVPGGEFAISGVAGFVVFLVTWLSFPPPESTAPSEIPNFNFHVPDGWTFKQTLDAIASVKSATADYGALKAEELAAPLQDYEIHAVSTEEAIKKLRSITKMPEAVRKYDVSFANATYLVNVI